MHVLFVENISKVSIFTYHFCLYSFNFYAYILIIIKTGKGPTTPAFAHSVQAEHHIFMNMTNLKAYCLPDNYEIIDSSLDDIRVC